MNFAGLVAEIVGLVNGAIIPLLFALAVVFFLVNILRYTILENTISVGAGDEKKQIKKRAAIMYGLIGLFVLFSIWGIVNLLLATLNSFITGSGATTTTAAQTTTTSGIPSASSATP
jgi:hypothetical protein